MCLTALAHVPLSLMNDSQSQSVQAIAKNVLAGALSPLLQSRQQLNTVNVLGQSTTFTSGARTVR